MQDKINEYNEIHNKSIERIKLHCKDAVIGKLCTWLMTTELNPYSYLTDEWAGRVGTATGMSGVMDAIHHAIYDDGAISFVKVNDQPRIIFLSLYDFTNIDNFYSHCLTDFEKELEHTYGNYSVVVLDCTIDEIGDLLDVANEAHIKRFLDFKELKESVKR